MDQALQLVIEMNQWIWSRFKDDLKDATPEEVDWPLPQANSISAILRSHAKTTSQLRLDGVVPLRQGLMALQS